MHQISMLGLKLTKRRSFVNSVGLEYISFIMHRVVTLILLEWRLFFCGKINIIFFFKSTISNVSKYKIRKVILILIFQLIYRIVFQVNILNRNQLIQTLMHWTFQWFIILHCSLEETKSSKEKLFIKLSVHFFN